MATAVPIFKLEFEQEIVDEFREKSVDVLTSGRPLSESRYCREFESAFKDLVKSKHVIAVNSGTMALEICLRAIGVVGKVVITPSNTFFATQVAAASAQAKIAFVDIEPDYLQICPNHLKQVFANHPAGQIGAVVLVHIGGIISPHFQEIRDICRAHDVALIEDAAHAHLSHFRSEYAGSLGDAAAFSFFPTKVMTAGEGGMITTSSTELYKIMLSIKEFGRQVEGAKPSRIVQERTDGVNGRISEMTGLLGLLECRRVHDRIEKRSLLVRAYALQLDPTYFRVIQQTEGRCAYYKCIVILQNAARGKREGLREYAAQKGVMFTGEVYFRGVHEMPAYIGRTDCHLPVTEDLCANHVCPPLYPELTLDTVSQVCDMMNEYMSADQPNSFPKT